MQQPKPSPVPEEIFFETIKVAQASAAAHQKAKLITTYPSQPWRSAVVTAFVTCPDDLAIEIVVAFHEAVRLVFERHGQQCADAKSN
jgi:hypothetical protein